MKKKLLLYILIGIIFSSTVFPTSAFGGTSSVYTAASTADVENIIFNAIQNREEAFKIRYTGNTSNIMSDILEARDQAVIRDPYEEGCISLISGFTVSNFSDHSDISFDSFKYYTTKDQETYVNQKIQEIVSATVNQQMSDNQKEKAIHDYIIYHVDYDNTLSGYTAYSALHEGSTVCNGFVQLAYRLLNAAGIETKVVKGKYNSIDHKWNLVKIDNHWYHLDCTQDDAISASSNQLAYEYYNISDNDIMATHQFNQADYPATDTKYIFLPILVKPFEDISLPLGSVLSLPPKATVIYEDESTSIEDISWTPVDITTVGTKTCTGTVSIEGITLTATVNIIITGTTSITPAPPSVTEPSSPPVPPTIGETTEITKYLKLPQAKNKMWTLKFNQEIDFDTVDSNTVFVIDSSGNVVEGVSLKRGKSSNILMLQPPVAGYTPGKNYCIYILKGVFSSSKKGLTKAIKIPFSIEN